MKIIDKILGKFGYTKFQMPTRKIDVQYMNVEKVVACMGVPNPRGYDIPRELEKEVALQFAKPQLHDELIKALSPFIQYEVLERPEACGRELEIHAWLLTARKK